ncbi:TIGR02587 family membrane protein [Devosia sp. YIM 151766]|uniref:TIGR02587 family membrane protein n=1 Tax=Devosia sp. YIM 151766 TaxID=3017325 RepID=UPI00255C612F|nr:TIGR02587 family membrane protein [Devosia sp. YIM 151766]WIY52010.1 TIGR02587 family membrane protein [Devosia sp. YIM 151766]
MSEVSDSSLRPLAVDLGRAFGGALIFSLPMIMTMEMWELGFTMNRWRLLLLLLASVPVLMFLSHYSGFERTEGWQDDLRDVGVAYGVGILASGAIMLLLAITGPGMSLSELVGKLVLQAVPAALGALLARSQLGQDRDEDGPEEGYRGELGVMAVGALFLSLNIAPTDETMVIAYRMTPWHSLLLVVVSILVMHGFVYAVEFKGSGALPQGTPIWQPLLRFTLVGYVMGLAIALYALWTFSRLDGMSLHQIVAAIIVLGFPAAIGAAAARLIL